MYPSQSVYLAQITSRTPTKRSRPSKGFWPRGTSSTPCDTYARWLECHLACCFGHEWVIYRGGPRIFLRRGCTTKKLKGGTPPFIPLVDPPLISVPLTITELSTKGNCYYLRVDPFCEMKPNRWRRSSES